MKQTEQDLPSSFVKKILHLTEMEVLLYKN